MGLALAAAAFGPEWAYLPEAAGGAGVDGVELGAAFHVDVGGEPVGTDGAAAAVCAAGSVHRSSAWAGVKTMPLKGSPWRFMVRSMHSSAGTVPWSGGSSSARE